MKIHQSIWVCYTLAIIVLIGALLRAHDIRSASLWTDELSSLQFSCGRGAGSFGGRPDSINSPGVDTTGLSDAHGWADVWYSSAGDTHPPLHALILRLWRTLFGEGDAAARSLSAVCSCLAILSLFDAVRSLHGSTSALFAAALFAVASPQIVNAQEARGYAMVVLLTLTMTAILLRIETRGITRSRRVALFFATSAAMLTHYAAMPFTLALIVYACVRFPRRELRNTLIAFGGAIAVFIILWGSIAFHQRGAMRDNLAWLADDGPGFYLRWLHRLATLPLRLFITPKQSDIASTAWIAAIFYLAPLLILRDRKILIWCLIGGACIGAVAASDALQQRQALEWERYALAGAPALYALIAALPTLTAETRTRRMLWLVPALFVIGCMLSVHEAYSRFWKADFRGFARDFDHFSAADDLIITHGATRDDWKNAILLAAISHYSQHPHRPTLILTHRFADQLPMREAWFVTTESNLVASDWIGGSRVVQQETIPFVGTFYRLRVEQ